MEIEAGRVLSERYRLIRPLGQGSQAAVWVADHLALQTHVAVKLIDPELAKRADARERFKREATAAAQLRSAHVVQILDHGIDGDQPFIVMEVLDGEDLFERLNKRGRLSLRETSRVVTQVARALTRAHAAGIVHRDLKPENVFLVPNDDDEIVKVLDFGVAKVNDPAKQTMRKTGVGTLVGTPHYMSPEQVKGIGEVDSRSDLWALGVIAFQCVTGELPFDSEGVGDLLIKISIGELPVPSHTLKGLPPAFDAWFARACARDLPDRFQTARELALSLAHLAGIEVKKPSMRPPSMAGEGSERSPSSPFLDEDEFEEVFDAKPRPTAPDLGRPKTDGEVPVDVGSQPPPSRPSKPVPLVVRSAPDSMREAPSSKRGTPHASTVDGLARSRNMATDPPPELDGTKRRRIMTWFIAVCALAAIGVAFSVIRSQMQSAPASGGEATATAVGPAPVEAPVVTTATPALTTTAEQPSDRGDAVEPGKLKHPLKPASTHSAGRHPAPKKKPTDGTVEIPVPAEDE